jgi:hypothetical protein
MLFLVLTLLSQPPEVPALSPHWTPGQELLFRGTVRAEALGQTIQLSSEYKLEVRALVLGETTGQTEIACCTKLTLAPSPGSAAHPASVHLTLMAMDSVGRIVSSNYPHGLCLPIDVPATWEQGWIVPSNISASAPAAQWEVPEPGRLPRRFQLLAVNPSQCQISCHQESSDWNKPRADSTAWKRSETITFDLKQQLPIKITRLIERRAPAHQKITSRLTTEYELVSSRVLDGPLLAVQRRDIEQIRQFQRQVQTLAAAAEARDCTAQFQRLARDLEKFQYSGGGTAYREALGSLQSLVQAGLENRLANPWAAADKVDLPSMTDCKLLGTDGKTAVTLSQFRGRPCLLIFMKPGTSLTQQVMAWANQFQTSLGSRTCVCLYLTTASEGPKILQATFEEPAPLRFFLQGQTLATEQKVTETPHFLLLNVDGAIAFECTGWGPEPQRDLEKRIRVESAKMKK